MMFFVYISGRFAGTVIALDETEARRLAEVKFCLGWGDSLVVERRRR